MDIGIMVLILIYVYIYHIIDILFVNIPHMIDYSHKLWNNPQYPIERYRSNKLH